MNPRHAVKDASSAAGCRNLQTTAERYVELGGKLELYPAGPVVVCVNVNAAPRIELVEADVELMRAAVAEYDAAHLETGRARLAALLVDIAENFVTRVDAEAYSREEDEAIDRWYALIGEYRAHPCRQGATKGGGA